MVYADDDGSPWCIIGLKRSIIVVKAGSIKSRIRRHSMHVPGGGLVLFNMNMGEMTDLMIRPVIPCNSPY